MQNPNTEMVTEKTWDEFRATGLGWWINNMLHLFGWSLVYVIEEGKTVRCFPARVKYRGFDERSQEDGFIRVTQYMVDTAEELKIETEL
jgi:hypothetical protein